MSLIHLLLIDSNLVTWNLVSLHCTGEEAEVARHLSERQLGSGQSRHPPASQPDHCLPSNHDETAQEPGPKSLGHSTPCSSVLSVTNLGSPPVPAGATQDPEKKGRWQWRKSAPSYSLLNTLQISHLVLPATLGRRYEEYRHFYR